MTTGSLPYIASQLDRHNRFVETSILQDQIDALKKRVEALEKQGSQAPHAATSTDPQSPDRPPQNAGNERKRPDR